MLNTKTSFFYYTWQGPATASSLVSIHILEVITEQKVLIIPIIASCLASYTSQAYMNLKILWSFAVHELLGLRGSSFQSLYHFTVGGPVLDKRIMSLPAYPGPAVDSWLQGQASTWITLATCADLPINVYNNKDSMQSAGISTPR